MNKGLNLLGLAQRAGKLVSGEQTVLKNIRQKQATLVLVCSDASDNTKKNISDKCRFYNVTYKEAFSSEELSHALGKKRSVCALLDDGFTKRMVEILES